MLYGQKTGSGATALNDAQYSLLAATIWATVRAGRMNVRNGYHTEARYSLEALNSFEVEELPPPLRRLVIDGAADIRLALSLTSELEIPR